MVDILNTLTNAELAALKDDIDRIQHETRLNPETKKYELWGRCDHCGVGFVLKTKWQRFCTKEHKKAYEHGAVARTIEKLENKIGLLERALSEERALRIEAERIFSPAAKN